MYPYRTPVTLQFCEWSRRTVATTTIATTTIAITALRVALYCAGGALKIPKLSPLNTLVPCTLYFVLCVCGWHLEETGAHLGSYNSVRRVSDVGNIDASVEPRLQAACVKYKVKVKPREACIVHKV